MTRKEAIAIIEQSLSTADEQTLEAAAELFRRAAGPSTRALSARELALLQQSKADFAAGRTLSFDELIASLDEHLAPLGVQPYAKS